MLRNVSNCINFIYLLIFFDLLLKFFVWVGLVWFGMVYLFTHSVTHVTLNNWTRQLQFTFYNTTCNIWTSTQYNIINNNTKFKDQLEVEFGTTSRYMCVFI
jgi:hypothetical protein